MKKAIAWLMVLWSDRTRLMFILRRIMMGDSMASARYQWHCICLDEATRRAFGKGMGNYVVPTREGNLYPNRDKE